MGELTLRNTNGWKPHTPQTSSRIFKSVKSAPGSDASCADVCRSAQSVVRWNLACRSTAETCELVNACERR
jgi:hypothetical protein